MKYITKLIVPFFLLKEHLHQGVTKYNEMWLIKLNITIRKFLRITRIVSKQLTAGS